MHVSEKLFVVRHGHRRHATEVVGTMSPHPYVSTNISCIQGIIAVYAAIVIVCLGLVIGGNYLLILAPMFLATVTESILNLP